MGRELVLKKIKNRAVKMIILSVVMTIILGLFAVVMYAADEPEAAIIMGSLGLLMLILMFVWIHRYTKPMCARCFKKNPRLLEQADELFADIVHKDKNIICSNRIIASAKDITQMAALNEITDVSENISTYYGIHVSHDITLTLPDHKIVINVYGQKKDNVKNLKYNIVMHCPKVLEKHQLKFGAKID